MPNFTAKMGQIQFRLGLEFGGREEEENGKGLSQGRNVWNIEGWEDTVVGKERTGTLQNIAQGRACVKVGTERFVTSSSNRDIPSLKNVAKLNCGSHVPLQTVYGNGLRKIQHYTAGL